MLLDFSGKRVIGRSAPDRSIMSVTALVGLLAAQAAWHAPAVRCGGGRLACPVYSTRGRIPIAALTGTSLPSPADSTPGDALSERRELRRRPLALRLLQTTRNAMLAFFVAFFVCLSPALPGGVGLAYADPAPVEVIVDAGLPGVARGLPGVGQQGSPFSRKKTSFVTAAYENVGPAVVRIDTERLVDRAPIEGYLFPGLEPDSGQRKESGQGSGVILSSDGLIMTNAHVVSKAEKVTVTLTDGRVFEGVVKGSDDFIDLAAIKIKPSGKPLPTAPLGKSTDLQVGDWVIAIGNAVGLDSTVTLGIVSSLQRSAAEVNRREISLRYAIESKARIRRQDFIDDATNSMIRWASRTRRSTSSKPTPQSTRATRAGRYSTNSARSAEIDARSARDQREVATWCAAGIGYSFEI